MVTPRILPIVIAPDPILKIPAAPLESMTSEIQQALDDMVHTMISDGNCCGLAGPQVSISKKMIVVDMRYFYPNGIDEHGNDVDILRCINPEIIHHSDVIEDIDEYCMSLPECGVTVARPDSVRVKYVDYEGKPVERLFSGKFARCMQHEIDHIEGRTLLNYASALRRDIIIRKLTKYKRSLDTPEM